MSESVPIMQGPDGKYRTRSSDAAFRDGAMEALDRVRYELSHLGVRHIPKVLDEIEKEFL